MTVLTEDEMTRAALWSALLLTTKEIVAHRKRQERIEAMKTHDDEADTFGTMSLGDFLKINPDRLEAESLIDDVIGHSLKLSIRETGEALFRALGSTSAMASGFDVVLDAFKDRSDWELANVIVDKAWDGIGANGDFWTP